MKIIYLILPVFVATSLASVYFLPNAGDIAQSAVIMELPEVAEKWHFNKIPASPAEIGTLSKDTDFSKAICVKVRPEEFNKEGDPMLDRIDLAIVLSGTDINNSIHRPERCMPAQGHQILASSDHNVKLSNGKTLMVKRLKSVQRIPINDKRTEHFELNCVTYYFFVGHDQITNDHLGRTFLDMKDRLIKGMDQRWAYVSTSMWHGELPWMEGKLITEEETDKKLSAFVSDFATEQINWDQIKP